VTKSRFPSLSAEAPRKRGKEPRTELLKIRLTPEERAELEGHVGVAFAEDLEPGPHQSFAGLGRNAVQIVYAWDLGDLYDSRS
jgi:hypothetical protein